MSFSMSSLIGSIRDSFEKRPVIGRIFLVILVLSLIFPAFRIARAKAPMDMFSPTSRSDFEDYHTAAIFLRDGKDPYRTGVISDLQSLHFKSADLFNPVKLQEMAQKIRGVGTYLYPPFWAYLLIPFSFLSYEKAAVLYQILSLSVFILFLFLIPWLLGLREKNLLRNHQLLFVISAAILILYRFLMENITNGNIAFFLILLIGAGLRLAFEKKAILSFAGGFLIGIATVIKVTPIYMGLVLLAGRRSQAIAGAIFGGIFGILIPATALGWNHNLELFSNWKGLIIENYSKAGVVRPWANNQTISGAAGKLLIPGSDSKQTSVGLPLFSSAFQSREDYAKVATAVRYINTGIGLLAILFALYLMFKGNLTGPEDPSPFQNGRFLSFLGFVTLVSLVSSGVSWYHSYSLLFFVIVFRFAVLVSGKAKFPAGERVFYWILAFFGFGVLLLPGKVEDAIALYSIFTFVGLWAAGMYGLQLFRSEPGA